MAHFLIVSRSFSEGLENLAEDLKSDGASVEILEPRRGGYRTTWWEVIEIYLLMKGVDALSGKAYDLIIEAAIAKAKAWYQGREKGAPPRPASLSVRDAEGRPLRGLKFHPDGKIEDLDIENERPEPPPSDQPDGASERYVEPKFESWSREERSTTVIFCDIANSTALLTALPGNGWHEWLRQCREEWNALLESEDGVIAHSYRDNVVGYFVDSKAGGDGARRAAAAALKIAKATPEPNAGGAIMQVGTRIGIATGVLSPYQLRPRGESPTLRAAALLSQVSARDVIAIDQITHDLVKVDFHVSAEESATVPQLSSSLQFWRLLNH